jgi:hypothetical protein
MTSFGVRSDGGTTCSAGWSARYGWLVAQGRCWGAATADPIIGPSAGIGEARGSVVVFDQSEGQAIRPFAAICCEAAVNGGGERADYLTQPVASSESSPAHRRR